MGFVNKMDQSVVNGIPMIGSVPICLNGRCCSSKCVVIVSRWLRWRRLVSAFSTFSKTCCQCNFSEIFKGWQIILELCRKSKYTIRYLLWWHKTLTGAIWTQAYLELLQTSKMECFCINSHHLIDNQIRKALHLRCLKGFWICLCWTRGRCKVCRKISRRRYVKCKSTWYVSWNISMVLANVWLRN